MSRIAKPWKLTEEETFSSFTAWQHNMVNTLRQDKDFAPFLLDTAVWLKQTAAAPNRGLIHDVGEDALKKEVKVSNLNSAL